VYYNLKANYLFHPLFIKDIVSDKNRNKFAGFLMKQKIQLHLN